MYADDLGVVSRSINEQADIEQELKSFQLESQHEDEVRSTLQRLEAPLDIDELIEDVATERIKYGSSVSLVAKVINKVAGLFGHNKKVDGPYKSESASAEIAAVNKVDPRVLEQATGQKDIDRTQLTDDPFRAQVIDALRHLGQKQYLQATYAKAFMRQGLTMEEANEAATSLVSTDSAPELEHSASYKVEQAIAHKEYGKAMWETVKGNWIGLAGAGLGGAGFGLWRAGAFAAREALPFLMSKAGISAVSSAIGAELLASPAVIKLDEVFYDSPWLNFGAQLALGGTAIAKGEDMLASAMKADKYRNIFLKRAVAKGVEKELRNLARVTTDPAVTASVRTRLYHSVMSKTKKENLNERERQFFEQIIGRNSSADSIEELQSELRDLIATRISNTDLSGKSKSYISILEKRKQKLQSHVNDLMESFRKYGPEDPRVNLQQQPSIVRAQALGQKIQRRLEIEQAKTSGFRRYKKLITQIANELTPARLLDDKQASNLVEEMRVGAEEAAMKAEVEREAAIKAEQELKKVVSSTAEENLTQQSRVIVAQKKYDDAINAAKEQQQNAEFMLEKAFEKQLEIDAAARQRDTGEELIDDDIFSESQKRMNKELRQQIKTSHNLQRQGLKPVHSTLAEFVKSSNMPDAEKEVVLASLKDEVTKLFSILSSPHASNKAKQEAAKQLKELKIL